MTKINEFNKYNLPQLGRAIDEALKAVGEEYGVKLQTGNCSYRGTNATFKLEAVAASEGGEFVSKEAISFERYKKMGVLTGIELGAIFATKDGQFEVTGYNSRASRYPLNAINTRTRKSWKFPVQIVRDRIALRASR